MFQCMIEVQVEMKCGQKYIRCGLKDRDMSAQVMCGNNHARCGLKGRDMSAQGNALGHVHLPCLLRPVWAQHAFHSMIDTQTTSQIGVVPPQGTDILNEPVPGALPWVVMLLPLTGRPNSNHKIKNHSAVSQTGQWYEVQVICDGAHIEVWWGASGSTLQRILSTDSATVLEGNELDFFASAYTMLHVDNIVVTADDPVTTTYQNASRTFVRQGGQAVRARARHVGTCRAWGRTVTKTQGGYQAVYSYRFGDKLKMVSSNFPGEAATVYYNYDGLGKRRNKTLDLATVTWWRWDLGWNPIQEYTDPDADWDIENLAATFVPGLAEIPGSDPSTGSYRYYMGDHLGSVRTLRDQNKAALASYEFMPYGETYTQSGLALNLGFTGHTWDKDDGLYYAPYRYYSPVASRWLTRDPLGMVDGPNIYVYVGDNPIVKSDRFGLKKEKKYPGGYCLWEYPWWCRFDPTNCRPTYTCYEGVISCQDYCDLVKKHWTRACYLTPNPGLCKAGVNAAHLACYDGCNTDDCRDKAKSD